MLRTIAAGLLTRKLARGVYRMSPNPIVRAAGTAAMGMAIARMMRPRSARPTRSTMRTVPAPRRGGLFSRAW